MKILCVALYDVPKICIEDDQNVLYKRISLSSWPTHLLNESTVVPTSLSTTNGRYQYCRVTYQTVYAQSTVVLKFVRSEQKILSILESFQSSFP